MHFWIDKRSQTCGFSGRHRVPTSLPASCGQQRRRRRRSRGKLMVTPVHRFQPIESVAVGARRSHPNHRQLHNYYPSPYTASLTSAPRPSGAAHSAELDSSVYLDIPLESHGEATTHHQQGDFVPVGRLKCGMWVSFALATGFVAGAKFYFDHQGSGLEVLVFCALLSVFFLAGCTVSLCRAKVTRDLLTAAVSTSQAPASATSVQSHELEAVITEVALSTAPPPPPPPELPPPPYHIAILLPQQAPPDTDESPPPSYEKAVS